jgi:hypothetical protein
MIQESSIEERSAHIEDLGRQYLDRAIDLRRIDPERDRDLINKAGELDKYVKLGTSIDVGHDPATCDECLRPFRGRPRAEIEKEAEEG